MASWRPRTRCIARLTVSRTGRPPSGLSKGHPPEGAPQACHGTTTSSLKLGRRASLPFPSQRSGHGGRLGWTAVHRTLGHVPSIDRRIDVAVMMRTTVRARPLPHRDRHFRHLVSTLGADLAAWIPTGHHEDRLSPLRRLVFSLPPEFVKAHIRNLPSKLMIFEHSSYIEILNGNDVKLLHEQGSQLVQGILSDIRDARMKPRDAPVGLVHNRHLRGVLGDLPHPGKLLSFDRIEWLAQCRIRRLYSGRIRFLASYCRCHSAHAQW